jgi:hypothetical protein
MISRSQVAHARQDRQHEFAGRVAGVQPFAARRQNRQADAALRQIRLVSCCAGSRRRSSLASEGAERLAVDGPGDLEDVLGARECGPPVELDEPAAR